jgi:hypothetical protein
MVLAIGCFNTKDVFLNERILPCSKQKNKHEQKNDETAAFFIEKGRRDGYNPDQRNDGK